MKKVFKFGKIAFYGSRKINLVTVEIELKENEKNQVVFTASANVWNNLKTDIIMGGQCLDDLQPYFKNNQLFNKIVTLWNQYHLNDMHAGTPEQEKSIKEHFEKIDQRYDYTIACDYLKSIGLYEVLIDGTPYKYGHAWLYESIPLNDLERIRSLFQ